MPICKSEPLPGRGWQRFVAGLTTAAALAVAGCTPSVLGANRERARAIPAPVVDETAGGAASESAVFAGGCFWGVQAVYQHVKGVTGAVSGYAGGSRNDATYEASSTGATGHAEAVQVTFDPRQVTYGQLLHLFFSVAHDPTQLNRQGPDSGTQYRSAIFPANAEQARIARAYIKQLTDARAFDGRIVTTIELEKPFYRAEEYHQDYLVRHPGDPYIVINDMPKLGELKRVFPDLYQPKPVLVRR